ncbi:hypothetical protein COE51_01335 [Bacillus pseudomycoides]|nr:hypothetical protein COE51_01335 [Bacillus pseudomycoides]
MIVIWKKWYYNITTDKNRTNIRFKGGDAGYIRGWYYGEQGYRNKIITKIGGRCLWKKNL